MENHDHQLGLLHGTVQAIKDDLVRVEDKLDKHIADENVVLSRIEQNLSIARFAWLLIKAVVLSIAFVLAFKVGDIAGLWKNLK